MSSQHSNHTGLGVAHLHEYCAVHAISRRQQVHITKQLSADDVGMGNIASKRHCCAVSGWLRHSLLLCGTRHSPPPEQECNDGPPAALPGLGSKECLKLLKILQDVNK